MMKVSETNELKVKNPPISSLTHANAVSETNELKV